MTSINQQTHKWCEQNNIVSFYNTTVDSTNNWAKIAATTNPLVVFLADHQNLGRGRGSNTWTNTSPGSTLLCTWRLRLEGTPQPIFSMRSGLLLWETLCKTWPQIKWSMKAPNDIYVETGKFAGILIEAEQIQNTSVVYIGIGANIYDSPQLAEQKTFHLASQVPVADSDWATFCRHFVKGLHDISVDAHREKLTSRETESLLTALQLYPGNQVQKTLPDGGLVLKNNKQIHWNEL